MRYTVGWTMPTGGVRQGSTELLHFLKTSTGVLYV